MGRSKRELALGSKLVLVRSKVLELELVHSKRVLVLGLGLARSKRVLGLVRSKQGLVLRSKLGLVRSSCFS